MDLIISNETKQAIWNIGYEDAACGSDLNPYEYDGDGNRAAAWEEGFSDYVNKAH